MPTNLVPNPRQPDQSDDEDRPAVQHIPNWLMFLLIIWVAGRPQRPPEITLLKQMIWAVMIVLVVLILATLGGADQVANVVKHLPFIP